MTSRVRLLTALLVALAAATAYAPPASLVTSLEDSGAGSLREAIATAAPGGIIVFSGDLSGQTILLQGTHMVIDKDLTISAVGLAEGITIDANRRSRHLEILSGIALTLDSMTLTKGMATGGYLSTFGGSVYAGVDATITLNNCSLLENMADNRGGAIFTSLGSLLTLNNCTLSNNSCPDLGGAINTEGSAFLNNCTIYGNNARGTGGFTGNGGAIFTFDYPMVLSNCTITGNNAGYSGGGISAQNGNVTINNSIIAENSASKWADIGNAGSAFVFGGANLIGNNDSVSDWISAGALVGTKDRPLAPRLAQLGDFGGPVQTMPPLTDSPAMDASSSGLAYDQRGAPRPQGAGFDIGAVETVALDIAAADGSVNLSWAPLPFPMYLQSAQSPAGPWSTFLGQENPLVLPLSEGNPPLFFHLGYEGVFEEGQLGSDKEPVLHRHMAVILIDFPDTSAEVKASSFPTPTEVREFLFNGRLATYFSDMSYGAFTLSGEVFGYFTHQNPGYVDGRIVEVEEVVKINSIVIPGFDANQYDGVVLLSVHDKGLAGGRASSANWINININGSPVSVPGVFAPYFTGFSPTLIDWIIPTGPDSSLEGTSTIQLNRFDRTFAHELFHYLGLGWHANSRTNGEFYDYEPEVPGNYQSGTSFPLLNWEYGNYYDVLGKSFYGVSLNSSQRDYLGWSNSTNRVSIKGYGRFITRIFPLNNATGIRMVEVRIPYQYNEFAEFLGRKNRGYFLEVRTGDNEWDNMLLHPQLSENNAGIMVNKTDGASSQLLDMSPSPNFPFYGQTVPDLRDVVLKPGMVYENDEVRFSNVVKFPDGSFTVEIEVKPPNDALPD